MNTRSLTAKELEDWERWSQRHIDWKPEDVQRLISTVKSLNSILDQSILIVPHGSALYDEVIALRHEILRKPLGLHFTPEQLAAEATHVHLAIVIAGAVKAALYLLKESEGVVRMRQVAVAEDCQGKGLGRRLVAESEHLAYQLGGKQMVLDARETAIPFYLKLGYEAVGKPFEQATIPHMAMRKKLG